MTVGGATRPTVPVDRAGVVRRQIARTSLQRSDEPRISDGISEWMIKGRSIMQFESRRWEVVSPGPPAIKYHPRGGGSGDARHGGRRLRLRSMSHAVWGSGSGVFPGGTMHQHKHRSVIVGVLGVVALVAVASCSGDDDSADVSSGTGAASSTTASSASSGPASTSGSSTDSTSGGSTQPTSAGVMTAEDP